MSWLWSPQNFWGWLGSIVAQFVVFVGLLTPIWGWLKGWTNPTTPGGAGSKIVAGREVHDILAEVQKEAT